MQKSVSMKDSKTEMNSLRILKSWEKSTQKARIQLSV
jgi:hypothetical protein